MIDVVQSVGRVMRKSLGKKYGYIILPIGIPADMEPEEALQDNKKYKIVWQVLQALRAHDNWYAVVNRFHELVRFGRDDRTGFYRLPGCRFPRFINTRHAERPLVFQEDIYRHLSGILFPPLIEAIGNDQAAPVFEGIFKGGFSKDGFGPSVDHLIADIRIV